MNPVELLSDLYALRQLYGVLQNGEGWPQHINSNNVEKALDTRARQLLKDLPDDAAERIFNTHSRVLLRHRCTSAVLLRHRSTSRSPRLVYNSSPYFSSNVSLSPCFSNY